MYKLKTFQPFLSVALAQANNECFNRSQVKILRRFNNKFQIRDPRPRDEDFQNSALSDAFKSRQIKTIDDWSLIKKDLTETIRQITVTNFDSIALGYCLKTQDYKLAELCVTFIQQENKNLSLSVIGKLFQIYRCMYDDKVFNGDYEDTVLKMYEDIRSKYKVLDSLTLESAIMALSATKEWQTCLTLLKEIRVSCVPNTMSYNYTATAAFKNKEYQEGWNLMHEIMNSNRVPVDFCYKALLLDCIENSTQANLYKLFHFLNEYDIVCSLEIRNLIQEASNKLNYTTISANLDEVGKCSNCAQYLPRVTLSQTEYDDLKEAFFKEVIIGENVFRKTNPDEVARFKEFLKTARTYDVIIDGLNVAYATGSNSHVVMANTLSSVVDYFTGRMKQVLVLGRLHMLKWPGKYMNRIKRNADIFLTQNLSHDDPYLLYCALHSGQNAIVVSRDYMRSHTFLLKSDHHRKLFKRWLVQCRHEFVRVQNNGKVIFAKPLPYLQVCQESESGWHVPYLLSGQIVPMNGKLNNWLCIQK